MRGLSAPVYGVVQELTTQFLSQCRCALGAQLAQQQQHLPWTSSSSSPQQQHPVQLQQQRGKHTVRVVLLKDHRYLGRQGDIVEVKAGHARQTLFPNGEADYAVPSVVQDLKRRKMLSEQALQQLRSNFTQGAAATTVDPSTLPLEQQLPQVIKLLSSKPLVVSRRFSWRQQDQPMVGPLTAQQLSLYTAKQLHIDLPRELIMMDDAAPITQYGSYKVPLNLRDNQGQQVELSVQVNKTYRQPGLRRLKLWAQQEGLMAVQQQQQSPRRKQQQQQPEEEAVKADVVQQPPPA